MSWLGADSIAQPGSLVCVESGQHQGWKALGRCRGLTASQFEALRSLENEHGQNYIWGGGVLVKEEGVGVLYEYYNAHASSMRSQQVAPQRHIWSGQEDNVYKVVCNEGSKTGSMEHTLQGCALARAEALERLEKKTTTNTQKTSEVGASAQSAFGDNRDAFDESGGESEDDDTKTVFVLVGPSILAPAQPPVPRLRRGATRMS